MSKNGRKYTYKLTARGIDYVMVHCSNVPDTATFADAWNIYRRHDNKYSPWCYELYVNDHLIDRWTNAAMTRWRKLGFIVSHADTFLRRV